MDLPQEQIAHRILLVDDDESIREMMNESLQSKGF